MPGSCWSRSRSTSEAGHSPPFPVAMYVRVVLKGAPAPAPGPADALAQYPFEDAAIVEGPINARISRAFTAPPGTYDVYVALTERPSGGTAKPKTAVVKQEVTIPDLKSGLTTSSIIVAEQVEADTDGGRATYEQQLDDPYGCGARASHLRRVGRSSRARSCPCCFSCIRRSRPATTSRMSKCRTACTRSTTIGSQRALPAGIRPEIFNAATLAADVQPERRRPDPGGPADRPRRPARPALTDWRLWSRTRRPHGRTPNGAVLRGWRTLSAATARAA